MNKIENKWKKEGLLFMPNNQYWWMCSHAQLPVAFPIEDSRYRIYFASRDGRQYSHIGYVEIDIANPHEILYLTKDPVLLPGHIGHFDEHGVFPASVVKKNEIIYLYYIGWNKGTPPPLFYASIGLAISKDGGKSFERYSESPIISRGKHDPVLVTSPHVYIEGDIWRMTYVSGVKWEEKNGKLQSYYHIKYAESENGIDWIREGIVSVDFLDKEESNIARSSVIKENGIYKMWYSYVLPPKLYRIGYAESADGKRFTRKDHLSGLDVTPGEFDSEMMCYPNIIIHKGAKYMFYNGNNFGAQGFGLAKLIEL